MIHSTHRPHDSESYSKRVYSGGVQQFKHGVLIPLQVIANSSRTIVPQLSKCLKFEAVWGGGGVLTDQMI